MLSARPGSLRGVLGALVACALVAGCAAASSAPRTASRELASHNVLTADGIGQARFGESHATAVRRIDLALGRRAENPYYAIDFPGIDHGAGWPRLIAYFHHGRFVGYDYWGTRLSTARGLAVGDSVARARKLYGSALRTSLEQGGAYFVSTSSGTIEGFVHADSPPLAGLSRISTIQAGSVGGPAIAP
jgi:hypothetical protein